MSEAPSKTIFVVGDRFPWPDEPSPILEKGAFDAGALIEGGSRVPCSIRKISALGATLCTDQIKPPGSPVAIELSSGHRAAGTIDWVERREMGIRFNEPLDMLALINRELVSQPVERRRMPRVELRCPVHIKYGEHFEPATLRNISGGGVQIEGENLPAAGTYIAVFVEGLNIPAGEVMWSSGNLAGIEVFEELSWTSIIPWVRDVIKKAAK